VFRSSERNYVTIGEVVEELRKEFPDLSISKVRYLEEEGLVKPGRTPGGYRKFSERDVRQLQKILKLQKEKYLPLSVIKIMLKTTSFDEEIKLTEPEDITPSFNSSKKTKVDDIAKTTDLSLEEVEDLENYNILQPQETEEGKVYDSIDMGIMQIVKKLSDYGIEPRHLRFYESFAEREASFFQQILLSSFKQKSEEGRKKAMEELAALTELTHKLKFLFLQKSIRNYFNIS